MDTVDIVDTAGRRHNKNGKKGRFCNFFAWWKKAWDRHKKSTFKNATFTQLNVDNVDNYSSRKLSPTFNISPAPIVINRSPFIVFFDKNSKIFSNVEK